MPDLYLRIAEQPDDVLDAIAQGLDSRAADPAMQKACEEYMSKLPRPDAEVLEIGCGNGAATAHIVKHVAPSRLTGIDPAEGLVARARDAFRDRHGVSFSVGDAVETRQKDEDFDVVVAHTVYSHLPDRDAAIAEGRRVLRPGGTMAIFDGDYAANTVALFDGDPLQAAMQAVERNLIHAPYVMRSLPRRLTDAGLNVRETASHGFVQTDAPEYLVNLIGRGVDAASMSGEFSPDLAEGFKREAERRSAEGTFYGAMLFLSVIAEKPAA